MKGRILVVWYSRSGITAKAAGELVAALECDGEEIVDLKSRDGALGFLGACFDAIRRTGTHIEKTKYDPAAFRLAVICAPVWAGTAACAIRQWMKDNAGKLPDVAFMLTAGSDKVEGSFNHMTELTGREPVARLSLRDKAVKAGECSRQIADFAETLRAFVEKKNADDVEGDAD